MGDTPPPEPFGLKASYLVAVRLLILWPYHGNGLRLVNRLLKQGIYHTPRMKAKRNLTID